MVTYEEAFERINRFRRPLTSSDIQSNVNALQAVVNAVTEATMPYKEEVEFIKASSDSVVVKLNGVEGVIGQRFCYFTPSHHNSGDIVSIDTRYFTAKK